MFGPAREATTLGDSSQYLVWIDAVGGYLLQLKPHAVIGQAIPGADVDLAVQGDISRNHAMIHRMGDRYALQPIAPTSINGHPVTEQTVLRHDDIVVLGRRVELRFQQPHPLSPTARLDLLSPHRWQPSVDGVLLMAESCVMGPAERSHIVCRPWGQEIVMVRHRDHFRMKAQEELLVGQQWRRGLFDVPDNAVIQNDNLRLRLEPIDPSRHSER